jgi:hypothetical protein
VFLSYLGLPENGTSPFTGLKAIDFFNVNGVKTKLELLIDFNLDLSLAGYADLVRCLNHYVRRLKPNERNNGSTTTLFESVGILKKPGKKMRSLFLRKRRKAFELRTQGATETFLNVSGASFPGEKQYGTVISIWNGQGITNRVKVFLFKFFNNILGINTRLSHFVPNQMRGCTFCSINGTNPVPDETFAHIFFD